MRPVRCTRLTAQKGPAASNTPPPLSGAGNMPAPITPESLGRRARVRLRRIGRCVDLEPRWADVVIDSLLPGSVGDHLLDGSIHFAAELGVAQLQAYAVSLSRERFADNLELACVLRLCGEAGQDHVVSGNRVNSATNKRLDALGVGVLLEQLDRGRVLLLDFLSRGRAGNRAQRLAVHRVRSGDVGVVGANEQVLTGNEVRTSEGDLLLALVGNRIGREDQRDLTALNRSLPLCRRSLFEDQLVALEAEVLGDVEIGRASCRERV